MVTEAGAEVDSDKIELVENLPFSAQDRANYLLTLAQVKPSSILSEGYELYQKEGDGEWRLYLVGEELPLDQAEHRVYQRWDKFGQIASEIGLPYHIDLIESSSLPEGKEGTVAGSLYLGQDETSLEQLLAAETDEEVGQALGYPETAIEHFLEEDEGRRKTVEQLARQSDLPVFNQFAFLPFVPSEVDFDQLPEEERELAEVYEQTVRDLSYELHQATIDELRRAISSYNDTCN